MNSELKINADRLNNRLAKMATIGGLASGGVKRLTLSREDKAARDLFKEWLIELGLTLRIDKIGNMFGILEGKITDQFIGIGSHLDSVPTGGKYDGPLGVLAALEVAQTIIENNVALNHSLVIANYTNEEGVRFLPDMMGSLAHAKPDQTHLYLQSKDNHGISVDESLKEIGYKGSEKCGTLNYKHFIELHIEQGPILEQDKIDIGVVSRVQAIYWIKIIIQGKSAHAGTTPLIARKDTFYALSRLSNHAREVCNEIENQLITIGSVELHPNAINVVPERVIATLDMRNPSNELLAEAIEKIEQFMITDESFQDLIVTKEVLVDISAVTFDNKVADAISSSCNQLGYSSLKMYSGAGHDAQILATKYSAAMIFIPSKDGISHAVDEYSSPEQIEKGANVLLSTVLNLDR